MAQLQYSHGVWSEQMDHHSSNYRELLNLVLVLEKGMQTGHLLDNEVWIFTDNTASEGVFWKGHSPSRLLNDLALRLRLLEMGGRVRIHMVHVAGTRMIRQGTDGLSRGDLTEGVMAGESMLDHVPLNESVLSRQPDLRAWVLSWLPTSNPTWLTTDQLFHEGHGLGAEAQDADGVWVPSEATDRWYIWCPPPALADIAVEELDVSRHKRSNLNHVMLLPRLTTYAWRKRLSKICDLVIEIPPGARSWWPASEHEPLLLGLTLCFSSSRPWQAKLHPGFLAMGRQLQVLWDREEGSERGLLCKLCHPSEWLGSV
jgi:hypothetical protein